MKEVVRKKHLGPTDPEEPQRERPSFTNVLTSASFSLPKDQLSPLRCPKEIQEFTSLPKEEQSYIIRKYEPFIVKRVSWIARKYNLTEGKPLSEELINLGRVGFFLACKRYDPTLDGFFKLASNSIKYELLNSRFEGNSTGRHPLELMLYLKKEASLLEKTFKRPPTEDELLERTRKKLGLTPKPIGKNKLEYLNYFLSISQAITFSSFKTEDEKVLPIEERAVSSYFSEPPPLPDTQTIERDRQSKMNKLLEITLKQARLTAHERMILQAYYMEELNTAKLAVKLGVSKSAVSQALRRALKKFTKTQQLYQSKWEELS